MFHFTEAISLVVSCESQAEVDELWAKLAAGGEEGRRGWLKDRYGLSWQIVPFAVPRLLQDPDPARRARVVQAIFTMRKIDLARVEQVCSGR